MYKRLELHNHTTESDASLTCEDLLRWMEADQVDAFGLTDHNTISGHPKMQKLLLENSSGIQCIYGMEYTTYYGHILCLNLKEYVPWETIDRRRPELLFQAIRDKNALQALPIRIPMATPLPGDAVLRWSLLTIAAWILLRSSIIPNHSARSMKRGCCSGKIWC